MAASAPEKRSAFVAATAAGEGIVGACRAAGIGRRTARRWLADPDFAAEVRAARAVVLEQALGRLGSAAVEAVDVLRRLLRATAPSVKLGAARALLEALTRVREHVEISERLAAMEKRLMEDSE